MSGMASAMVGEEIFWGTKSHRLLKDPRPYGHDGKARYTTWRMMVYGVVRAEKAAFPSAESLILWGLGLLEGRAAEMAAPWVEERVQRPVLRFEDFEEFMQHCDTLFDDQDMRRKMQAEFFAMKQGKQSFFNFYAQWAQTLAASGLVLDDDAKERALLVAMDQGLRFRATSVLVTLASFMGKVDHLKKVADAEEAIEAQKTASKAVGSTPRQQQPQQPQQRQKVPPADADAMDWTPTNASRAKWVDEGERRRRRENALCLRCGGADHQVRACGALPARPPPRGPTVATVSRVRPDPEGVEEETKPLKE